MAPPAPPPPPPPPIQGADTGVAATPNLEATQEIGSDGGQSSGAGAMASGTSKEEKSMTLDEVRKQSCNWSMASDAGLLLYLQEFSHKMIARTSELEKMVDGLVNETKSTDSKVHNTLNDFLMIANTQFVENRVYDDSEEMDMQNAEKTNSEKKEVTEVDLIPKVSKALNLGINVIDTAFDTLDANAGNSDSEDDDVSYRHEPILEPKDPYSHRPLPHIIGSRLFMEEDDVGLVDYISEADDLSGTASSVSESEEESDLSESEYSESESESDLEEGDIVDSPVSDADEDDLFGGDSDEFENGPQKPDFTSELAAKIAVGDQKDQRRDRSSSKLSTTSGKDKKKKESEKKEKRRRRTSTKSSSKMEDDDPFGVQHPPDDIDDMGAFSGKGLFSGGKGLFDDEDVVADDEDGLFDDKPSKLQDAPPEEEETKPKETKPRARTRSGRKVPAGGVSMFGAATDELFGSPANDAVEEDEVEADEEESNSNSTILRAHFAAVSKRPLFPSRNKHSQKSVDSKGAGGLFDDNEDNDEDDLFADAPVKKEPLKASTSSGLFEGDEEDELFGESSEPKPAPAAQKKKLPAGAVSMFGSIDPLAGMKKHMSDTEEHPEPEKPVEPVKKPVAKPQKSSSLFDDEDDLFGIPSVSSKKESPQLSRNSSKLFDDDDDGLFTVPKEEPAKPQSAASKKQAASMFDDEADEDAGDDLFAAAAKPKETGKKKKPVGGVAIFGGEDLFAQITQKEEEKTKETEEGSPEKHEPVSIREQPPTPRKNTFSLFYDEDEKDEDELFPSSSSSAASSGAPTMREDTDQTKAQRRRAKSKSVFDDEDVLFGSRQEEAPQVDLFSGTSSSSPPKQDSKKAKTGDIFDDDDDDYDDLFAEKKLPTELPNKVTSSKPTPGSSPGRPKNLFVDDEDDDLFGPEKPVKPHVKPQVRTKPPITKPRNQRLKEPTRPPPLPIRSNYVGSASPPVVKMRPKKNESKGSSDILADKNDDDLFGSKEKIPPPVGGASMFGTVDPLNVGKASETEGDTVSISSSVSSDRPTANGISAPKQRDPLFGSPPEDGDLFSPKSSTFSAPGFKSVKPPVIKPVKAPAKRQSYIEKMQANVTIDPSRMRPGAAPVIKEPESDTLTFDQPAEANTLPSLNKNRVKVGSRRRPPSRNRREAKSNATEPPALPPDLSNDMDFATTYQPLPDIDSQGSETYESYEAVKGSKSTYAKVEVRSKTSNDISGVDDLFNDSQVDPLSRSPPPLPDDEIPVKSNISKTQLLQDDPLFSASPASNSNNSSKSNHLEEDDLFGAPPIVEKPVSSLKDNSTSSITNSQEKKVEKDNDEDDDLFGSSTKISDKRKQIASRIDVDEDLFSSPSKAAAAKVDIEIEEDLFSSPSKSKDKPPMRVAEDELFTSPKKDSKRPKSKTVRVDTDLFADTTDIFADIPNSKSKEKKSKKKTDPLSKGVQGDDIFADTSSSKPKRTKSKKKTGRKSGGSSIFNSDAPSIFDDPLNATQQE
ncbi:WASH complex subunit 2-like isoform X3 [Anneissia japonica]|uniref:WASH complex subunit 2-like isoform X3 n=1 Tax=Anneissia japonica TaxID=1529436 RepID=UPI001425AD29|nr:WASH complex subunit 2-like isoform X3 [Anneissia japonica]